jgi:hypothetical protein
MHRFFALGLVCLLPLASVACASAEPESTAGASSEVRDEKGNSDQLLTQVFMRQVLTAKMLKGEKKTTTLHYDILKVALEGPGDGKFVAQASLLGCDRAAGSDFCKISIGTDAVKPSDEETEAGYTLSVRVVQGSVVSAEMELTAG